MALTIRSTAHLDGEAIVSLALVKEHLKLDADYVEEDVLIAAYRDAAIDWIERHTECSLAPRTWSATFDGLTDRLELPRRPVTEVSGVAYLGPDGGTTNVQSSAFRFVGEDVVPNIGGRWPAGVCAAGAVQVTFDAGFADVKRDAPALVAAVTLLAGHLYRNREAVVTGTIATNLPLGVASLCEPYRQVRV